MGIAMKPTYRRLVLLGALAATILIIGFLMMNDSNGQAGQNQANKVPLSWLMDGGGVMDAFRLLQDHKLEKIRAVANDPVQRERQKRVRDYCEKVDISAVEPNVLRYYDEQIAYCRINKCASTFTLRTLEKLFACYGPNCQHYAEASMVGLSERPYQEKQAYIRNSFSFYFTREPYRRFFSTYCNKFYIPKNENWGPVGPAIVRRYRTNPSPDSLTYGHDITFLELIQYVVDEFEAGHVLDIHIRPMHLLCNPCNFNYSFIGNLETLKSDFTTMLDVWNTNGLTNNTLSSTDNHLLDELNHLTRSLKLTKGSGVSVYSMFHRCWTYFQIVGKISKHMPMPFSSNQPINVRDFNTAIMNALAESKKIGNEVGEQRDEALFQAYSKIPSDLLVRLRQVALVDCEMFGYDDQPAWLFKDLARTKLSEHKYFVNYQH